MQFSFSTTYRELTAALDAMVALTAKRAPVPVLGCVLLTVNGTDFHPVTMEAFDYEVAVTAHPQVWAVTGEGRALVSRQLLAQTARSFAAGSSPAKQAGLVITITVDGADVILQAEGYQFTLRSVDSVDEYPTIPMGDDYTPVTVDRDVMLATLARVQINAGTDASLPMLTGIKVEAVAGGLRLVATDRFRIGIGFVPTHDDPADTIDKLVPASLLGKVLQQLPAGQVTVGFDTGPKGRVTFFGTALEVSIPSLDNEFVKYRSLIPTAQAQVGTITVSRAELLTATRRAAVLTETGKHLLLTIVDGVMYLRAGSDEHGRMESRHIVGVQHGNSLDGAMGFNPAYLMAMLKSVDADMVDLRYSTPARPLMLAEQGQLDNEHTFRALCMPARLPGQDTATTTRKKAITK